MWCGHSTKKKIEKQIELGEEGLVEQDWWLLDINLSNVESSLGEDKYYWAISIQTAKDEQHPKRTAKNNKTEEPRQRWA